MKFLFLLGTLLISVGALCQTPYPKRVLGSFVFEGVAYNYEFNSANSTNYSLRISTAHQSITQQPVETDTTSMAPSSETDPSEKSDSSKAKVKNKLDVKKIQQS